MSTNNVVEIRKTDEITDAELAEVEVVEAAPEPKKLPSLQDRVQELKQRLRQIQQEIGNNRASAFGIRHAMSLVSGEMTQNLEKSISDGAFGAFVDNIAKDHADKEGHELVRSVVSSFARLHLQAVDAELRQAVRERESQALRLEGAASEANASILFLEEVIAGS